jgi:hypothetical protein
MKIKLNCVMNRQEFPARWTFRKSIYIDPLMQTQRVYLVRILVNSSY